MAGQKTETEKKQKEQNEIMRKVDQIIDGVTSFRSRHAEKVFDNKEPSIQTQILRGWSEQLFKNHAVNPSWLQGRIQEKITSRLAELPNQDQKSIIIGLKEAGLIDPKTNIDAVHVQLESTTSSSILDNAVKAQVGKLTKNRFEDVKGIFKSAKRAMSRRLSSERLKKLFRTKSKEDVGDYQHSSVGVEQESKASEEEEVSVTMDSYSRLSQKIEENGGTVGMEIDTEMESEADEETFESGVEAKQEGYDWDNLLKIIDDKDMDDDLTEEDDYQKGLDEALEEIMDDEEREFYSEDESQEESHDESYEGQSTKFGGGFG